MTFLLFFIVFSQVSLSVDVDGYHQVPLARVATTQWTHVCTTGLVTTVRKQADGDWHIRLTRGQATLVLEIIPRLPLSRPRRGETITACGITRYDKQHKWYELHPLIDWAPDADVMLQQMQQSR